MKEHLLIIFTLTTLLVIAMLPEILGKGIAEDISWINLIQTK